MSEPTLDQYPGYYPAGSRPFWSRPKVAIAAGVAGLLLGLMGDGSSAEPERSADDTPELADVRDELEQALAEKAELSDQLEEQREDAAAELAAAEEAARIEQRKAVKAAVVEARKDERRKAARTQEAAGNTIAPLASTQPTSQPSTDPRFSYCYEANAAGYGSYVRGEDPEYAWYDDRDGDGVVCEF